MRLRLLARDSELGDYRPSRIFNQVGDHFYFIIFVLLLSQPLVDDHPRYIQLSGLFSSELSILHTILSNYERVISTVHPFLALSTSLGNAPNNFPHADILQKIRSGMIQHRNAWKVHSRSPLPQTTQSLSTCTMDQERHTPFLTSLLAGGLAGTTVDLALFPIDTLKTRLQSPHGFIAAGGFNGVYRGVMAAAAGSSPGAALFFGTYETMKPAVARLQARYLGKEASSPALTHMIAASIGEAAACLVRVPTEVLKSKMQTNASGASTLSSTLQLVLSEKDGRAFASSIFGGLYRGYGITLMREVPFAFIQFPLYERMKIEWGKLQGKQTSPLQAAMCGSLAGGVAAGVTTPLDVVKTRLMLGSDKLGVPYIGARDVIGRIIKEEGSGVLLSGIQPRVMWISIGGFVFFGAYESYRSFLMSSFAS